MTEPLSIGTFVEMYEWPSYCAGQIIERYPPQVHHPMFPNKWVYVICIRRDVIWTGPRSMNGVPMFVLHPTNWFYENVEVS